MFSRLISSMGRSVGAAFVAWINPHLTVRDIVYSRLSFSVIDFQSLLRVWINDSGVDARRELSSV